MGIKLETAKKIYLYAHKICERHNDAESSQNFLIKSLQAAGDLKDEDLFHNVSRALINEISSDKIDTERLFHLSLIPAVKALQNAKLKDAKQQARYKNLYKLFDILLRRNTEDFFEFKHQTNIISELDIEDKVLEKIRVLTLCSEGLANGGG